MSTEEDKGKEAEIEIVETDLLREDRAKEEVKKRRMSGLTGEGGIPVAPMEVLERIRGGVVSSYPGIKKKGERYTENELEFIRTYRGNLADRRALYIAKEMGMLGHSKLFKTQSSAVSGITYAELNALGFKTKSQFKEKYKDLADKFRALERERRPVKKYVRKVGTIPIRRTLTNSIVELRDPELRGRIMAEALRIAERCKDPTNPFKSLPMKASLNRALLESGVPLETIQAAYTYKTRKPRVRKQKIKKEI